MSEVLSPYHGIAAELRGRIADGTYPPGSASRARMVAAPGQPVGSLRERVVQGVRLAVAEERCPWRLASNELELAAEYGVSRKTVRQALEDLERGGEIVNHPGRRRQIPGTQAGAPLTRAPRRALSP